MQGKVTEVSTCLLVVVEVNDGKLAFVETAVLWLDSRALIDPRSEVGSVVGAWFGSRSWCGVFSATPLPVAF